MIIKAISDLHLGCGDKRDDFYHPNIPKEKELEALMEESELLIICGDGTDNWEINTDKITERYPFYFVKSYPNVIKLRGNHDNIESFPECFKINKILFIHGHQFDKWNHQYKKIGWLITKLNAGLEWIGITSVDRVFKSLSYGRYGSNVSYFKKIEEWVDEHPQYEGFTIIFGHTHEYMPYPVELRNCKVMNTGSWTGLAMNVLTIEI